MHNVHTSSEYKLTFNDNNYTKYDYLIIAPCMHRDWQAQGISVRVHVRSSWSCQPSRIHAHARIVRTCLYCKTSSSTRLPFFVRVKPVPCTCAGERRHTGTPKPDKGACANEDIGTRLSCKDTRTNESIYVLRSVDTATRSMKLERRMSLIL